MQRDLILDVTVECVNIKHDMVVLNMGGVAFDVPITNYYDEDGIDTWDRATARACVAGADGLWVTIHLAEGTCSSPQSSLLH